MPEIEQIRKTAARIRLVRATASHAALLHAIFTGTVMRKYSPVSPASVDELARRLAQSGKSFSERALFHRFFGKVDGEYFGTFIMKNIDWDNAECEIGFSLLDEFQGRGLGSALVYKCIAKLFREAPIDRVWATVGVANAASNSLMRRLGLRECGFHSEVFLIQGKPVRHLLYQLDREQAAALFPPNRPKFRTNSDYSQKE